MREQTLIQLLKKVFGYSHFRHCQLDIINSILDGHDTLAIMPTGGGKSLCYQLPALMNDGACVVISPLISLMQDQVMNLHQHNIQACYLNSTQTYQEQQALKEKVISDEIKLVYISPESVLLPRTLEFLGQIDLSLIAVDEAHCVSAWGHEFREDYRRLGELKGFFPKVPILALTATADSKTRQDICRQLMMNEPNIFLSTFDRPNIKYLICERGDEVTQLTDFITKNHQQDTGIVYCMSRKKVEKIAEKLSELGFNAVPYHAGLPTEVRARHQKMFNEVDNIIVVATVAFGMGIDRPDVRFVAHLDLPKSIEGYYQETGRAGRDGKPATAWMVYGLQDVVKLSHMLETTDANENYKRVARLKMDSMLSLCETANCRRHFLLKYFEEVGQEKCGNCDSCLEPVELWDATVAAQKLMSAIYRTGSAFGANYIIDVLRGSKNAKIGERSHDQLSVYGIGKDNSKSEWASVIRQLLNLNYIAIKDWDFRTLGLTEKSREILTGGQTLHLRKRIESTKAKFHEYESPRKQKGIEGLHGRDDLFEKLREVRMRLAQENNIPPYIVFGDKSLHEMCTFLPKNESEFLMINGVGQSKLERYGSEFIEAIRQHSVL